MIQVYFVWLLNFAAIAMIILALLSWEAMSWISGSAGLGALFEMLFLIFSTYLLAAGFLLLAWPQHVETSYYSLRKNTFCRIWSTVICPLILCALFLSAFVFMTVRTNQTNSGISKAAADLLNKYDNDNNNQLSRAEYQSLMLDIYPPPGQSPSQDEFKSDMENYFQQSDQNGDNVLSHNELVNAILLFLDSSLSRLSAAFLVLAAIVFIFIILYAVDYRNHQSQDLDVNVEALLSGDYTSDGDKRSS